MTHALRPSFSTLVAAVSLGFLAACGGGGSGGGSLTFTYFAPAPTYNACALIASNVPVPGALAPTAYAIAPALPAGLALDLGTGVISGTPTATAALTNYVVTATTPSGNATAEIDITVTAVTPAFGYGMANVLTPARGVDFTSVAPTVTAGNPVSYAITAGTLPTGITFDTNTGVFSGAAPFATTEVLTVQASDCSGATADVVVTVDVGAPSARGVYVANGGTSTISSYLYDAGNGSLRATGYAPSDDGTNFHVVTHPSGNFVFASTDANDRIEVFAADANDGRLSAPTSFVDLGTDTLQGLAIEPRGETLLAITDGDLLFQFAIDQVDGSLTALVPASVATAAAPREIVLTPSGEFAYVACLTGQSIEVYERDSLTGEFAFVGSQAAGFGVSTLAVHTTGAWLYAGGTASAILQGYLIDPLTGLLSAAPWSPYTTTNADLASLSIHASGDFLYAANTVLGLVHQWELDPVTGEPSDLVPHTVTLATAAWSMALEPQGGSAFVVVSDGSIAVFDVDAVTGQLTPAVDPFVHGQPGARRIAFQPAENTAQFATEAFYTLDVTNSQVHAFSFDSLTGAFAVIDSYDTGANLSWGLAVHPTLPRLYVSNDNFPAAEGTVVTFTIGNDYSLTPAGDFGADTDADGLCIDPSGRFLFQSLWTLSLLRAFAIDGVTGDLTEGATTAVETQPGALAFHPAGRLLVVPNSGSSNLSLLSVAATDGTTTLADLEAMASIGAYHVAHHTSGRFVYVANHATGQVSSVGVDIGADTLTEFGTPASNLGVAFQTAVHPDGRHLVAVDAISQDLAVYAIDLDATNMIADGTLALVGTVFDTGVTGDLRSVGFDATGQWLIVTSTLGVVQVRAFASNGTVGTATGTLTTAGNLHVLALRNVVN